MATPANAPEPHPITLKSGPVHQGPPAYAGPSPFEQFRYTLRQLWGRATKGSGLPTFPEPAKPSPSPVVTSPIQPPQPRPVGRVTPSHNAAVGHPGNKKG